MGSGRLDKINQILPVYVGRSDDGVVDMFNLGQRFALRDQMIVDADEMGQLSEREIKAKRNEIYYCYTCQPSHEVTFVHLQDPRYKLHGTFRHACHVNVDRSGCSGNGGCGGGGAGESDEHFNAKYLLQKHVGRYGFNLERCSNCHRGPLQSTKNAEVVIEERVTMDSKLYAYDSVLKRNGKSLVVMEVLHTHKTTKEKENDTRRLGIGFAEFKASEIIAKLQDSSKPWVYLHNHRANEILCKSCKDKQEKIQEEFRRKAEEERIRLCEQREREKKEAEEKRLELEHEKLLQAQRKRTQYQETAKTDAQIRDQQRAAILAGETPVNPNEKKQSSELKRIKVSQQHKENTQLARSMLTWLYHK